MKRVGTLSLILGGKIVAAELQTYEFLQPHMGCVFLMKIVCDDPSKAKAASDAAFKRIAELDHRFSDYRADSELSLLSPGKAQPVSSDMLAILNQAQTFWKWSDGAFDVTLGNCTKLWRASRKSGQLPNPSVRTEALNAAGFRFLEIDATQKTLTISSPKLALDLGGIAKGFAVDEVTKLFKETHHLTHFMIDAGGQIAAMGHPIGRETWGVAIEKPPTESEEAPTEVLRLKDRHLATSGDLHQHVTIDGKQYCHIIDPPTGLGLTRHVQASVVALDGTTADAVATALCILTEEKAKEKLALLPGVDARVVTKTETGAIHTWQTKGWQSYKKPPTR